MKTIEDNICESVYAGKLQEALNLFQTHQYRDGYDGSFSYGDCYEKILAAAIIENNKSIYMDCFERIAVQGIIRFMPHTEDAYMNSGVYKNVESTTLKVDWLKEAIQILINHNIKIEPASFVALRKFIEKQNIITEFGELVLKILDSNIHREVFFRKLADSLLDLNEIDKVKRLATIYDYESLLAELLERRDMLADVEDILVKDRGKSEIADNVILEDDFSDLFSNNNSDNNSKMCSKCGTENPVKSRYCFECGTKLQFACPNCGSTSFPTSKFCGECGTKINN